MQAIRIICIASFNAASQYGRVGLTCKPGLNRQALQNTFLAVLCNESWTHMHPHEEQASSLQTNEFARHERLFAGYMKILKQEWCR